MYPLVTISCPISSWQELLSDTPRLPGVDGNNKMGKSLGNAIYLSDDKDTVIAKIKSALTVSGIRAILIFVQFVFIIKLLIARNILISPICAGIQRLDVSFVKRYFLLNLTLFSSPFVREDHNMNGTKMKLKI